MFTVYSLGICLLYAKLNYYVFKFSTLSIITLCNIRLLCFITAYSLYYYVLYVGLDKLCLLTVYSLYVYSMQN